jgi:hypothetical protein
MDLRTALILWTRHPAFPRERLQYLNMYRQEKRITYGLHVDLETLDAEVTAWQTGAALMVKATTMSDAIDLYIRGGTPGDLVASGFRLLS